MLRLPRERERKARGSGTQVWKVELKRLRKSVVGEQWGGSEGWKWEGESMVLM